MQTKTEKTQRSEEKEAPRSFVKQLLELAIMLAVAMVLAFGIRTFLVQPFLIPTGSMIPTIKISNRLLVDKLSYRLHDPKAGDIVTFPDPTGEYPVLIKRLIATAGQVVDIQGDKLYIDGELQDEPYVHGQPTAKLHSPFGHQIAYPYTIPEGKAWVMGDNRGNSGDSRVFGPIDQDTITGRAFFTYWPLKDMGSLK